MVAATKLDNADSFWDFLSRPENANGAFELVEGAIVQMTPASAVSTILAAHLLRLLGNFIEESISRAFWQELTAALS